MHRTMTSLQMLWPHHRSGWCHAKLALELDSWSWETSIAFMEKADPRPALGALMEAYQKGEITAFEELYRSLGPALRRYLVSLTLSTQQAEDLLQETFLQIHRSRHTYVPPRPLQPWIFGIARHVFLMDRRSRTRRLRNEVEPGDELPDLPAPNRFDAFPHRDQLRRAIATLPPDRREPLLLHHVWGFSFKEVGSILGIREGAAKVRAHRAIAHLRAALGGGNAS